MSAGAAIEEARTIVTSARSIAMLIASDNAFDGATHQEAASGVADLLSKAKELLDNAQELGHG
jgi:hypothetical protein